MEGRDAPGAVLVIVCQGIYSTPAVYAALELNTFFQPGLALVFGGLVMLARNLAPLSLLRTSFDFIFVTCLGSAEALAVKYLLRAMVGASDDGSPQKAVLLCVLVTPPICAHCLVMQSNPASYKLPGMICNLVLSLCVVPAYRVGHGVLWQFERHLCIYAGMAAVLGAGVGTLVLPTSTVSAAVEEFAAGARGTGVVVERAVELATGEVSEDGRLALVGRDSLLSSLDGRADDRAADRPRESILRLVTLARYRDSLFGGGGVASRRDSLLGDGSAPTRRDSLPGSAGGGALKGSLRGGAWRGGGAEQTPEPLGAEASPRCNPLGDRRRSPGPDAERGRLSSREAPASGLDDLAAATDVPEGLRAAVLTAHGASHEAGQRIAAGLSYASSSRQDVHAWTWRPLLPVAEAWRLGIVLKDCLATSTGLVYVVQRGDARLHAVHERGAELRALAGEVGAVADAAAACLSANARVGPALALLEACVSRLERLVEGVASAGEREQADESFGVLRMLVSQLVTVVGRFREILRCLPSVLGALQPSAIGETAEALARVPQWRLTRLQHLLDPPPPELAEHRAGRLAKCRKRGGWAGRPSDPDDPLAGVPGDDPGARLADIESGAETPAGGWAGTLPRGGSFGEPGTPRTSPTTREVASSPRPGTGHLDTAPRPQRRQDSVTLLVRDAIGRGLVPPRGALGVHTPAPRRVPPADLGEEAAAHPHRVHFLPTSGGGGGEAPGPGSGFPRADGGSSPPPGGSGRALGRAPSPVTAAPAGPASRAAAALARRRAAAAASVASALSPARDALGRLCRPAWDALPALVKSRPGWKSCAQVSSCFYLIMVLEAVDAIYYGLKEKPVWAILAVMVVAENTAGASLRKAVHRLAGTVCGGLGAMACVYLAFLCNGRSYANEPAKFVAMAAFLALFEAACALVSARSANLTYPAFSAHLALTTGATAGFLSPTTPWENVLWRTALNAIGVAVVSVAVLVVFPVRASDVLRHGVAGVLDGLAKATPGLQGAYEREGDESGDLGSRRRRGRHGGPPGEAPVDSSLPGELDGSPEEEGLRSLHALALAAAARGEDDAPAGARDGGGAEPEAEAGPMLAPAASERGQPPALVGARPSLPAFLRRATAAVGLYGSRPAFEASSASTSSSDGAPDKAPSGAGSVREAGLARGGGGGRVAPGPRKTAALGGDGGGAGGAPSPPPASQGHPRDWVLVSDVYRPGAPLRDRLRAAWRQAFVVPPGSELVAEDSGVFGDAAYATFRSTVGSDLLLSRLGALVPALRFESPLSALWPAALAAAGASRPPRAMAPEAAFLTLRSLRHLVNLHSSLAHDLDSHAVRRVLLPGDLSAAAVAAFAAARLALISLAELAKHREGGAGLYGGAGSEGAAGGRRGGGESASGSLEGATEAVPPSAHLSAVRAVGAAERSAAHFAERCAARDLAEELFEARGDPGDAPRVATLGSFFLSYAATQRSLLLLLLALLHGPRSVEAAGGWAALEREELAVRDAQVMRRRLTAASVRLRDEAWGGERAEGEPGRTGVGWMEAEPRGTPGMRLP